MKKTRRLLLIFLATWLLVLPTVGNLQPAKAQTAPSLPQPQNGDIHHLVASTDSSQSTTITDEWKHRSSSADAPPDGTQKISYWYWVNHDLVQGELDPSGGADLIMYSFDGITREGAEYYLAVSDKTLKGVGIYAYFRDTNKFVYCLPSQIRGSTVLKDPEEKLYLTSLIAGTLDVPTSYYKNIENLTPEATDKTTASLNCPDFGFSSINYGDISDMVGKFKSTDVKDRVNPTAPTQPRPPSNAYIKVYYWPPGSPVYDPAPIFTKEINSNGKVSLSGGSLNNLRKGTYYVTSQWALKNFEDSTPKWEFDNLEGGAWSNIVTDFKRVVWPWELKTNNPYTTYLKYTPLWVAGTVILNRDSVRYKVYGASTAIKIDGGNGDVSATTCRNISFDATRWENRDFTVGTDSSDSCGPIQPETIFMWAFCQMLSALKSLAEWSMCKATAMFTQMTNLATMKTSDSSALPACMSTSAGGGSSGSTAAPSGGSTPTPTPTPTPTTYEFDKTVPIGFGTATNRDTFKNAGSDTIGVVITPLNAAGARGTIIRGSVSFSGWSTTSADASAHVVANTAIPTGYTRFEIVLTGPGGITATVIGNN